MNKCLQGKNQKVRHYKTTECPTHSQRKFSSEKAWFLS